MPLFVLDEALLGSRFAAPNRVAFLLEALRDLGELAAPRRRAALTSAAAIRSSETIAVARECGADASSTSAPTGAPTRGGARSACAAPARSSGSPSAPTPARRSSTPGTVTPAGGDHFKVFTPFHRAWEEVPLRPPRGGTAAAHGALAPGGRPAAGLGLAAARPPSPGGHPAARREGRQADARLLPRRPGRLRGRATTTCPGDATSRLSPYLRFGCLSPLELVREARPRAAAPPSPASSAGATSTTRCSPPSPPCPAATTVRAATAGRARGALSRPGGRAAPATRSSTRRCGSCSTRAACTTGRG